MGKNVLLFRILYAGLVLSVLADVIFRFFAHSAQEHAAFLLQEIPGFSAFYGFIACILIIFVSKRLGQRFLQRDEGYYDYWGRVSGYARAEGGEKA